MVNLHVNLQDLGLAMVNLHSDSIRNNISYFRCRTLGHDTNHTTSSQSKEENLLQH
jgi:hypothetical protein